MRMNKLLEFFWKQTVLMSFNFVYLIAGMTGVSTATLSYLVFPLEDQNEQEGRLFQINLISILYCASNFMNLCCLKILLKSYSKAAEQLSERGERSSVVEGAVEQEEESQSRSDEKQKRKEMKTERKPVSSIPIYLVELWD